ncbi:glycosyltransferase family 2 protein [Hathewaya massiliensis]|uniref:glycosyltransferase family 2 protein n=1 Tax=Hathewaya massiliensis TaxID=1964382 RepID=UPI001159AB7D|nr:glycosyltransferase family 2 protein [Hathewaya massiliensis]
MNIKISVVVPMYNVENYIGRTLESIKSQSFKDFELIVINDGSTDKSLQVVEDTLDQSLINWRIINKKNEGVSKARNLGIEEAKGKYIYFLDGDDYIEESLLEKMYHCAENSGAEISFCGYVHVNEKDGSIPFKVHKYIDSPIEGVQAAAKMLQNNIYISAISGFYLREFLKEKNLRFDSELKFGEDTVFIIKALMNAKKVACIKESLVYYLRRNSSVTKRCGKEYFDLHKSNLQILNYNREFYKSQEVEKSLREYAIPQSIMRIFSKVAQSGQHKEELLEFINNREIKAYLKGFKANGEKSKLKFKVGSLGILVSPKLMYRIFRKKGEKNES